MSSIRLTRRPGFTTRALFDELPDRLRQMLEGPLSLDPMAESLGWMPAMELVEKNGALVATAELPGIDPADVEINVEKGVLSVRGEKKEAHEEKDADAKYHVWERRYGSFARAFVLPCEVDLDKVNAVFEKGVLMITLPKSEKAKAQGKKIPIAVKA
jgi:HSP20 family protein